MLEKLKEIELEYAVEKLEYKGQKVWPYLRIYLATKLLHSVDPKPVDSKVLKSFLRSFFYGFFNLFKSYNYLYFTGNYQRKKTGKVYTDKGIDPIATYLKNGLVFEIAEVPHFKKSEIPTENIASKFILYFLFLLHSKVFQKKVEIENKEILEDILKRYGIKLNYKEIVHRNYSQYKVMLLLLKFYKPKAVFMACYYTNMGLIKAFKERAIKVIEVQHGVINKSHEAYNVFKEVDSSFYPDHLLTFGLIEKETFGDGNFCFKPENVHAVGHFYLDYIANSYSPDEKLEKIGNSFKKIVSITSQNHVIEVKLIEFVIKSANLDPSILFIFIPRSPGKKVEDYAFPSNVIIVDWLNCYEIMSQSDFHSTVFSTCAIEAPSIGIQNIMINIDNMSKIIYEDTLTNASVNMFIESPEEYVKAIYEFKKMEKSEIIRTNMHIVLPDYSKNLVKILDQILSK